MPILMLLSLLGLVWALFVQCTSYFTQTGFLLSPWMNTPFLGTLLAAIPLYLRSRQAAGDGLPLVELVPMGWRVAVAGLGVYGVLVAGIQMIQPDYAVGSPEVDNGHYFVKVRHQQPKEVDAATYGTALAQQNRLMSAVWMPLFLLGAVARARRDDEVIAS